MKTTKGPWYVSKTKNDLPGDDLVSIRSSDALIAEVYAQRDDNETWSPRPNADHIVKCVNMHDELLDFVRSILDGQSYSQISNSNDKLVLSLDIINTGGYLLAKAEGKAK